MKKYSITAQADNLDAIFSSFTKPSHIKPKIKIAIVNVFYPPQAVGGATRVVYDNVSDIIAEFGDQFDISIFTSQNGAVPYELTHYTHDGVSVTAVTTETTENLEQRVTDPQMAIAFSRFLEQTKPDLVHFHCIQRLTTSIVSQTRQQKIPYIITAHDGWWISDAQFLVDQYDDIKLYQYDDQKADIKNKPNARQLALKKDLLGAKNLAAVSEPFANIYKSAGVPNVITIENGVSKLDPAPRRRSPTGRVKLAHIGGMARHKGFHLVRHALMASPEFSNLELLVVDHARPKGSIATEQWGGTAVSFVPKVDQKEITSLFADIDVLLAPSIWPESYGLVTREALMCGCHVIAGDRGGIGLCVDHGMNGMVIPVDNADALKSALAEVNANSEFYLNPPESIPPLRMAVQQARDLVKLYRDILS